MFPSTDGGIRAGRRDQRGRDAAGVAGVDRKYSSSHFKYEMYYAWIHFPCI